MTRRAPAAVCFSMLALGTATLSAVERTVRFEHFGPADGLPHNTVNDILQDERGFLWLATDGGLSRYDGYGFVNYRIDPAISGSSVLMGLLEASAGNLWVGSETGLWRFDRATDRFVPVVDEERNEALEGYTEALLEDRRGRLWAGVAGTLYRSEPGADAFRPVDVPGPPFERVWSLAEYPAGNFWAVVGDSEALRPELRRIAPPPGPGEPEILPIAERFHLLVHVDSRGRFWTGPLEPTDGLRALPRASAPDIDGFVTDVVELDDGTFWLGSDQGLFRFDPATGRSVRHPLRPDAPSWQSEHVRSLLVDRAGGLWVGTLGGLFHHDPYRPTFRQWTHDPRDPSSLSAEPVSDIIAGPDGDLWIGTFGGGLNRVDPATGRAERFRHDPADPTSLPDDVVWSLTWDDEERLWIGTEPLSLFDPRSGRFTVRGLPLASDAGGRDVTAVSLRTDSRRRVWVGTHRRGLFGHRIDTGTWRHFRELDTNQIVVSGPDRLWIASEGAISRLDSETGETQHFRLHSTAGRPLDDVQVHDLWEQGERLWLATSAGLGRLDLPGEVWTLPVAADAMPGTVVFSIQPDRRGDLWLGTNQGLVRFRPDAGPGRRVRSYDPGDGVGNMEFNRHSRYRDPRGVIYMGGMSGVTVFRPEAIRENPLAPPVVLTGIAVLGEQGARRIDPFRLGELELPPGTSEVTFSFTALDFTRAEDNRYAYRLEGFDKGWIDGGTERSARYTHIPPGSYVFRVRGSNNDGFWSQEGASLSLEVLPAFWQTWWFRLLIAGAIVVALVVVYNLRTRRLIELERMRLRIAGDLHDELGSELSGIALATSRLAGKQYLDDADRQRLDDVRASSVQVMQGLRDIVWYVNPDHDSTRSLEARMRSAAAVLLAGLEHRFDVDLQDDGDDGIDMVTRRNLYLIYKELLSNAARHAGASRVDIRFTGHDGELVLEVADDGCGFDPQAENDGSGLDSVRRRAKRIHASLEIDSHSGRGTRVRLVTKMTRTRQSGGPLHRPRIGG